MGILAVVALAAIGLLVYAVLLERQPTLDLQDFDLPTRTNPGGVAADRVQMASLRVDGRPFGAIVRIDADSAGTLPLRLDDLAPGDYLVSLEAGEQMVDTLVTLTVGQTASVVLQLDGPGDVAETAPTEVATESTDPASSPPAPVDAPTPQAEVSPPPPAPTTGLLRVTSRPSGATVYVDGVEAGTTPLALPAVAAGERTITARLPGHQAQQQTVPIRAGRDQSVRFALPVEAGPATLQILARPWGSIYIDGTLHRRNTDVVYRTQLPAGVYEVRVVHPTFGTRTRRVTLGGGQTTMEVFDLTTGAEEPGR